MNPMRRTIVAAVLVATVLAPCVIVSAEVAAARGSDDSFYSYAGKLEGIKPGTPLKHRGAWLHLASLPLPLRSEQILYRTTDERGRPSATVATLIRPLVKVFAKPRLLSFQIAYDGLSATCAPSSVLAGGGAPNVLDNLIAYGDSMVMATFLARGYTIVTTDYEGIGQHFGAGHEAAHGVLDGIRAVIKTAPELTASTRVGLFGYSGGGIATAWANELATTYAPELNIVGSSQGAFIANMAHNLRYAGENPLWSVALSGGFVGLARAYGVDLNPYLSEKGKKLVSQIGRHCIGDWFVKNLGGKISTMFKPQYADPLSIPIARKIANDQRMGRHTPAAPIYMGIGNYDGTGDGIMLAADLRTLAAKYCRAGAKVHFQQFAGDHFATYAEFMPGAMSWLERRFAGHPVTGTCSR